MSGRILAIDPGERRIGIALSDPTGTIASPHSVIDRRTQDEGSEIRSICDEYDVERIVVGLPLHLRGGEGGSAEMARRLAAVAAEATGIPVELVDERFTTKTAEAALLEGDVGRAKRKELRDKVAAAVLLQGYLDAKRDRGHAGDDRADGPSTV